MSDSLFLPRELFQTATPHPAAPTAPLRRSTATHFASGAEVAADLLQAMCGDVAPVFVERRRRPRPATR